VMRLLTVLAQTTTSSLSIPARLIPEVPRLDNVATDGGVGGIWIAAGERFHDWSVGFGGVGDNSVAGGLGQDGLGAAAYYAVHGLPDAWQDGVTRVFKQLSVQVQVGGCQSFQIARDCGGAHLV
jgi:hypothetical protein